MVFLDMSINGQKGIRGSFLSQGLLLAVSLVLLCGACATPTRNIDMFNDRGKAVMGLDYRDFEKAAGEAVDDMLRSGALNKPGNGRYVLAIYRVINDTMQRIDTAQLTKKIRVALLNSGKVVVTTAVAGGGPEDKMAYQVRELRKSDEFNQRTVPGKGQMISPDLSLSGKIIQRNIRVSKREQQVEYYFQLSLTDTTTGLAFWEGETVIGKRGSNKAVSW